MLDVFVGGVSGLDSLKSSSSVSALLATGRAGLYLHGIGVQYADTTGTLSGVLHSFSQTASSYAELGFVASNPASFFTGVYTSLFLTTSLRPTEAAVNLDSLNVDQTAWAAYVGAARSVGLKTVSPIFSPNDPVADPVGDFGSIAAYASLRAAALVGGGIALDTPPAYALARGPDYISTSESEILWARANGIKSTVILSPYNDYDTSFREHTLTYLAQLAADGALPDAWIVETYSTDGSSEVGAETDPESVAGVALWVAQNIDTPSSMPIGPASLSWTTAQHLGVGGSGLLTIKDTGGQAYVVGGAGGLSMQSSGTFDKVWTAAGSTNTVTVGDSATIISYGQDTVALGANAVVNVYGNATIQGGGGSSYFKVSGTASLFSRSATSNGDVIQAVGSTHLNLTVTGTWFTLFDAGAAVHVVEQSGGDNNSLDASGGGATIYGGIGSGLNVQTAAGQATTVTLGSGRATVFSTGNDTLTGSTGASSYFNISGTTSLLSRSATSNGDVIQAVGSTHLNLTVTGTWFTLFDAGAAVHVVEQSGGDNNSLDASGGGATIYGGIGSGLNVQTAAGQATTVTLGSGRATVFSTGNDTLTGSTGASSYFNISGTTSLLSRSATSNGDVIQAVGSTHLNLTVTGTWFTLFDAGAAVHVVEQSGGDNNSLDASGGGATIYGGIGSGLNVQTAAGQATTVTLGSGRATVFSTGNDTLTGSTGASSYFNISGTASLFSRSATSNGDVIQAVGSTHLNLTVTGTWFTLFDAGAAVHVVEQSGGDNNSLDASGGGATIYGGIGSGLNVQTAAGQATTVTLGSGRATVFSTGNDTLTGSTGASSYFNISGTTSLLSRSATSNGDVIQAVGSTHLNLTVTGTWFTLFDAGAAVHVVEQSGGDNNSLDASGGGATIYGGIGSGLNVQTAAGQATTVTLGSGRATVFSTGNDTLTGSTGASSYFNISGTASLFSRSATSNGDVIQAVGSTHLNLTVTGTWFTLFDAGAAVHVVEQSGGDNNSLDASGGGATIYGGIGSGLNVQTAAGQATTVTLGSGRATVFSTGNDTLTGSTGASSYFNISGTTSLLSRSATSNGDVIQAVGSTHLNLTVTGTWFTLFDAGAAVHVVEQSGGDNNSLDASGGGATIYGGIGSGLNVQTAAGQATTVTTGTGSVLVVSSGNDTIIGGSGTMNFIGGSGQTKIVGANGMLLVQGGTGALAVTGGSATNIVRGGTGTLNYQEGSGNNVTYLGAGDANIVGGSGINTYHFVAGTAPHTLDIQNYHIGRDSYDFTGYGNNPVASQSLVSGSLHLALRDGSTVIFEHVTSLT